MTSLRISDSGFDVLHTQATQMQQRFVLSVNMIDSLQHQSILNPYIRSSCQNLQGICLQIQSRIRQIDRFVQESNTVYQQIDHRLCLQASSLFGNRRLNMIASSIPTPHQMNISGNHQGLQTYVLKGKQQWNGIFQHNQGLKPLGKGVILDGSGSFALAGASYRERVGNMQLQGDLSLGHMNAFGKSRIALRKDGVFDPSLNVDVGASASLAHGKIGLDWDRDWIGASAIASGELGSVDAKGTLEISKKGVHMEGDVGAAMAKGKISGSIELFGFTFTATAHGEVGSIGVGGKFVAESNSFEIGAKASCLFGGGVDFKVDW